MEHLTRRNFLSKIGLGIAGLSLAGCHDQILKSTVQSKPNVLFIAVDDLNDWIGCLGGHPQVKTPNIDRLAASGVLFTNAHCTAPACNPSRSAIMTGISPHKSGIYSNAQKMREVLPDADLMPKYFTKHGYWSADQERSCTISLTHSPGMNIIRQKKRRIPSLEHCILKSVLSV